MIFFVIQQADLTVKIGLGNQKPISSSERAVIVDLINNNPEITSEKEKFLRISNKPNPVSDDYGETLDIFEDLGFRQ